MTRTRYSMLTVIAASCAVSAAVPAAVKASGTTPVAYIVPRIEGVTVDGSDGDWGKQGFRVDHIAAPEGTVLPAWDFDVRFRLGWNEDGLLVFVTVSDDIPVEAPDRIWRLDCVEIYVGEHVGSANYYQVIVNSGADPEFGSMRFRIFDKRPEDLRGTGLTVQTASRVVEGGYTVEALLPWANLGIRPETGTDLAFQLVANDEDGVVDTPGGALRAAWYPSTRSHEDPASMYTIRLEDEPGDPVLFRIDREIDLTRAILYIRGTRELVGEPVVVRSGKKVIARKELKLEDGRAGATFIFGGSEAGTVPRIGVELSGRRVATFGELPTMGHILDRHVEATGGIKAAEKLATRVCSARLVHNYPDRDPPVETVPADAYAKVPGIWAVVLHYAGGDLRFGYDGGTGWVRDSEAVRRDERMDRLPLGLFLNPHGAMHLNDYFGGMILKEKAVRDGREVYVARSNKVGGSGPMHFDVESGLLTRAGSWSLGEYREVDGIKFPYRIAAARRGGESVYEFDEVRHNVSLDDGLFTMPEIPGEVGDVFGEIDDARVLPMLRHLPYRHGGMNIPPRDGRLLYNLIVGKGYKRGLEIGTSNGYSTLWLGLAFRETGGEVVTIEIEPPSGKEARDNFRKAGLDDVIDARIADAFEEIPAIEGTFDFVFIDASKPDYTKFLELVRDRVPPGGAITAHNVLSHGSDMRAFLDVIESDSGLETTIHRTGEAGVSVSIVRR